MKKLSLTLPVTRIVKNIVFIVFIGSGFVAQASVKECIDLKTQQIVDELDAVGAILQPIHTENILSECKLQECVDRKVDAIIKEVEEAGGILKPLHTEIAVFEKECKAELRSK